MLHFMRKTCPAFGAGNCNVRCTRNMKDVDKTIVKDGINKAISEFSSLLKPLGFTHSKKWLWVREKADAADFIHLHLNGSSYGAPINYSISFRVHCGYRYFNESFPALALNGPCSTDAELHSKKYHHRFNAKSGSTYELCMEDLMKFTKEIGEPWFSQLKPESCEAVLVENVNLSRKLLGFKNGKK